MLNFDKKQVNGSDFKSNKNTKGKKTYEKISWESFQREYLTRKDNFKYEWVNGEIEKTLCFELINAQSDTQPKEIQTATHESQFFILDNLLVTVNIQSYSIKNSFYFFIYKLLKELRIVASFRSCSITIGATTLASQFFTPHRSQVVCTSLYFNLGSLKKWKMLFN
ncbi:MAG: Fe-S cluster biosynthesis and repair protein YggX [Paraglaciecola sp.]|jgi:Fe-S cluster biosynthesis and repair protein YggX